jgi:lysyl-tRNA synthetase class 2
MPSTVIRRFAYDYSTGELWVEFVTGRRYVYSGVPETVAATLGSAFAKGVYFNTRIRDKFPHREVTHEDEGQETQS